MHADQRRRQRREAEVGPVLGEPAPGLVGRRGVADDGAAENGAGRRGEPLEEPRRNQRPERRRGDRERRGGDIDARPTSAVGRRPKRSATWPIAR